MANWISGAVKHPGAFKRKAKKAGMTTSAYATKVLRKPAWKVTPQTRKQASLAQTLAKLRKKK